MERNVVYRSGMSLQMVLGSKNIDQQGRPDFQGIIYKW